jgi:hypothetical protein
MADLQFQVQVKGLEEFNQLNQQFPSILPNTFRRTAAQGMRHLMQVTPADTGHARRNWKIRQQYGSGQSECVIYNETPYLIYHELGTGIYGPRGRKIIPTRAKALMWMRWKHAPVPKNFIIRGQASSVRKGSKFVQTGAKSGYFKITRSARTVKNRIGWIFASVRGVRARHFVQQSAWAISGFLQNNFTTELKTLLARLQKRKAA